MSNSLTDSFSKLIAGPVIPSSEPKAKIPSCSHMIYKILLDYYRKFNGVKTRHHSILIVSYAAWIPLGNILTNRKGEQESTSVSKGQASPSQTAEGFLSIYCITAVKSHSEMQTKQFLGQADLSHFRSPLPCAFVTYLLVFHCVLKYRHSVSSRRNVKTLLWWLTVSVLQTIHDNLCSLIYYCCCNCD